MTDIINVPYTDVATIKRIGELRAAVWRPFHCKKDCWTDEYDTLPTCHHWVILDHDQIVASVRLTVHTCSDHEIIKLFGNDLHFPVALMGRLVVEAPYRGRGYAQELNRFLIQAAKDLGCTRIVVIATHINVTILLKLGFVHLMQHDSPVTIIIDDDYPITVFYAMQYTC